jgi:acetyl-CoA C-acetyltransferase
MSGDKVRELGLKPIAKIVSYGTNAQDPVWFTTAPAEAMRRAMKKAGWEGKQVDLWEVNEAFAVVALAAQREMEIPMDRLNVRGGGISLGHPIGASGARIVITLISSLKEKKMKRGVAGICIGGGEGTALCVELV